MQQRNKIFLVKLSTIRSVLAGFFILLFAFGITPKLTLHNLVATHKDGKGKSAATDDAAAQLSRAGFNCQCDHLIIESPFVDEKATVLVSPEPVFASYQNAFVAKVYSAQPSGFSLRGPPAC